MGKKINVAIIFGGKSVEHEVSLQSGRSIALHLDPSRYTVHYIGIDRCGNWNRYDPEIPLIDPENPKRIQLGQKGPLVHPFNWTGIDVAFPILHGPLGEDGTVQGLLRLSNIPFVGADVLGSAIGIHKEVAKKIIKEAGILVAPWICLRKGESIDLGSLQYPLFVKPSTGGSSVGISKVEDPSELACAVELAHCFSEVALVEEALKGREVQVALIGNHSPKASLPCEIIPKSAFHTYESKYIEREGAQLLCPAPLDTDETAHVQKKAREIYEALSCEIYGRVDLFLMKNGQIYFNEINTTPGLTSMSSFFKMWKESGFSPKELLDELIAYALERHEKQKQFVIQLDGVKNL